MSRFIYALSLRIYSLLLHLIAPFHPKAKQWVHGRHRLFDKLRKFKEQETRPIIWMHCASLGEFEQGRPLLESCKQQYTNYAFVLSFFSPSGYEIRKNSPLVDAVFYLPLDNPQHANNWLDTLQPSVAIFVKYDLWYHYLTQLKKRAIPNILISASFRPQQLFFKFYGGFFRKMLYCFDHIFLQEQSATSLLDSITISNYTVAGDTRIDRVIQNKPDNFLKVLVFANCEVLSFRYSKFTAIFTFFGNDLVHIISTNNLIPKYPKCFYHYM